MSEEIVDYDKTICWNCIHSAAPVSLRCIWDATSGKVPVKGAVVEYKLKTLNQRGGKRGLVGIVHKCPQFETIFSVENRERVRRAREHAAKAKYAGIGVQQSNLHNQGLSADGV